MMFHGGYSLVTGGCVVVAFAFVAAMLASCPVSCPVSCRPSSRICCVGVLMQYGPGMKVLVPKKMLLRKEKPLRDEN
jgi:hypothetical protein